MILHPCGIFSTVFVEYRIINIFKFLYYMANALSRLFGVKHLSEDVFLYLSKHGTSSVKDISFVLHIPKTSIYDALDELVSKSLVIEYSTDTHKTFTAIDASGLQSLIKTQIDFVKETGSSLVEEISSYKPETNSKPKIKFYFGSEGIRQAFRDTMWNSKYKETYLMWPTKEMVEVLTPEFCMWHAEKRLKHKVFMRVIRKSTDADFEHKKQTKDEKIQRLVTSTGWSDLREERTAPKDMQWNMSFWIYGDTCLCASGGAEKIAFVIKSKEFSDLMTLLWKQVWVKCE